MAEEKDFEYAARDEKLLEDYFINTTQGGEKSFVSYDADEFDGTSWKTIWTHDDCRTMLRRFTQLKKELKAIAALYDEIGGDECKAGELLSPKLFQVWQTYLSDWRTEGFDKAQIDDICERSNALAFRERVTRKIAKGEALDEEDREILQETADISVTDAESELVDRYNEAIVADAKRRVGANVYAFEEVFRAKCCYRRYHTHASDFLTRAEERFLAQAMVRHAFGKRVE